MAKNKTEYRSDDMYKAVLAIRDEAECKRFFEELCSPTELKSMEQRFEVAVCLEQNMVYTEILKKTGTSTATISRVKRNILENKEGSIMEDLILRCGLAEKQFFPQGGDDLITEDDKEKELLT